MGEDDYIGIDLRTRNDDGECSFYAVLFEECDIEEIAAYEREAHSGPGYDQWLDNHIDERS